MPYVRSWTRLSVLLVFLSFPYSAHAAGAYLQTFDSDPPPGWVEVDAWSATAGYYVNANTAPFRAIAYFADRRWDTDFTYSLRMYSDLGGTSSHKVGVVLNFVDEMNYLEVAIDMLGNVELNQVSGGVRPATPIKTAHVDGLVKDAWFDVTIVRSGPNKVRVRIGNQDVLTYDQLSSAPLGYIGVLSQFNWGRFDDVKVTPVVFRAGFGAGTTVTPNPTTDMKAGCVGPAGEEKYQVDLTGTESATGTVWPPSFWGAPSVVLMNTILGCDKTFSDYLDVRLKSVTFVNGQTTQVLSNTVKNVTAPVGESPARLGLGYSPTENENIPSRFYVRRYIKYSSQLANPGAGKWFVQQEFKNKTCSDAEPPRRLILYWHTDADGKQYYRLRMDHSNNLNCGFDWNAPASDFPEQRCFAAPNGPCPAFITNQWFYDEYFVQYSSGGASTDRVAYAINGQVIFDYPAQAPAGQCTQSKPCRVSSSKPRGIKLTPGYTNIPNVEVQADDVEVYHDMPCRTFPCGAPSHY